MLGNVARGALIGGLVGDSVGLAAGGLIGGMLGPSLQQQGVFGSRSNALPAFFPA